jgi:hypothetical protein
MEDYRKVLEEKIGVRQKKRNRRSIILHTGKGCEGLWTEEEKTKYLIIKQEITTDEPYSKFGTETKIYNFERINVNSDEE